MVLVIQSSMRFGWMIFLGRDRRFQGEAKKAKWEAYDRARESAALPEGGKFSNESEADAAEGA